MAFASVVCRRHRVFIDDLHNRGDLVGIIQDGSREGITAAASSCADGMGLSPTSVQNAVSGNL